MILSSNETLSLNWGCLLSIVQILSFRTNFFPVQDLVKEHVLHLLVMSLWSSLIWSNSFFKKNALKRFVKLFKKGTSLMQKF